MFKYKEIVLLAVIFSTGSPWVLRSTRIDIVPNLTVRCHCESSVNSDCNMDHLMRIRLLKQNDAGNWTTFAEISEPNNLSVSLSQCLSNDIVASGHLGTPGESFLSVTWTTASDDTVGSYQCQVDGFGEDFRSDVHLSTQTVNITSFLQTTSDPVQIQSTIVNNNSLEVRYWPQGHYALLSPVSGCPDTPVSKMVRGSINVTTETAQEPNNKLSSPSHLHPDVFERMGRRNNIHFRFCRNPIADNQVVVSWPKGSYCIHQSIWRECPNSLNRGYIYPYLNTISPIEGTRDTVHSIDIAKTALILAFCCRNDEDPNVPILLPTNKPFYLLRYKGNCQKVRNMDVSDEWIQLDSGQRDYYYSRYTEYPDSDLNDFTLRLCYYTKRK